MLFYFVLSCDRNQFSTTDVRSLAYKTNKQGLNRSFRKGKRPKDASPKKSSDATGDWMTPKNCTAIPKDAGKRRVHASGHQSGHWFTDQNGRKVIHMSQLLIGLKNL